MSDGSRERIRVAAVSGVKWMAVTRVFSEGGALVSTVILARLIPPHAFGDAAPALIIASLAMVLGAAGLTSYIVREPTIEQEHLETASFMVTVAGIALTGITLLFALTVGHDLFAPETARLMAMLAPVWLVFAVLGVPQARLHRELRFRRLALLDSGSQLFGLSVTLALAFAGVNAEALIAGPLATAICAAVIARTGVSGARPRFHPGVFRQIGAFTANVTLSAIVWITFRNIDYAVLRARIDSASVGFYYRAYQLGVDYQGKVSQVMMGVAFPVYSRADSLEELRRFRARMVQVHATVILPILALFAAVAPDFIPLVYGRAWEPAVTPARILALAGMATAIATGTGPLMAAVGKPGALVRWAVPQLLAYVALVALLAPHGLTTVAIGVAAFTVSWVVFLQAFLVRRAIGLKMRDLAEDVAPGIFVAAVVFTVVELLRVYALDDHHGWLRLIALCVGAIPLGLVALRLCGQKAWDGLASVVTRARRSG